MIAKSGTLADMPRSAQRDCGESAADRPVPAEDLRVVMRRHAAAVWIATTADTRLAPVGITVSSFTSVSLDPPLVGFFVAGSSRTREAWREGGPVAVHLLTAAQGDLALRFASSTAERFAEIAWSWGATGAPLLCSHGARLEGRVERLVEIGDHVLVVAAVSEVSRSDDDEPFAPLVHHAREFGTVTGVA